jgi:hypothetical protein
MNEFLKNLIYGCKLKYYKNNGENFMYILDENLNKKLNTISLFLTESEAINLLNCLESVTKGKNEKLEFFDDDKKKVITIIKYDRENIENLSPRIQKLVQE